MFFKTLDGQGMGTQELLKIIDDAKSGEICRDPQYSIKAFKPIWDDVEKDPDFSNIEQLTIRAELYRLAGFFLSFYGKSKNKKHYQSRAKTIITKAVNLFLDLGLKDKSDEAHIMLALCYWYSGNAEDCENILDDFESEYQDTPHDSAYLLVKITRAITFWLREDYDAALKMIETLSDKMMFSYDDRLKMSYHNQAGAMFLKKEIYDKAINHFQLGIKYAVNLKSLMFQASMHNNIAVLYQKLGETSPGYYNDAFENVEKAIDIFETTEQPGWLAVAFDTQAGILLQQNKLPEALETINRAIDMMRDGDDYSVLVEALSLRFSINLKLNDLLSAFADIAEAAELARLHIGDFKVENLKRKAEKFLYVKEDSTLNELDRFKKYLVKDALIKNNHHREKSARTLGITRAGLYEILKKEIPSIVEDLNIEIRHWGPTSKEKFQEKKQKIEQITKLKIVEEGRNLPNQGTIKDMNVSFDQMVYPGKKDSDKSKMRVFYIPHEIGEAVQDGDSVVLCSSSAEYSQPQSLIIFTRKKSKTFYLALAGRNDINKSIYIQDIDTGVNLNTFDVKIVGKIIGFCSSMDAVGEILVFKSFGGN